jgi:hypothetical protein
MVYLYPCGTGRYVHAMAPVKVKVGNMLFDSKAALKRLVREQFQEHRQRHGEYSDELVSESVMDKWMRGLIERHPRGAAVTEGWNGTVKIKRLNGNMCAYLVKPGLDDEDIGLLGRRCITGKRAEP